MTRHFLAVDVDGAEPAAVAELVELALHRRRIGGRVAHAGETLSELALSIGREVKARRPPEARGQDEQRTLRVRTPAAGLLPAESV